MTFPIASQSFQSTPIAQLTGIKIFPSTNWISTSVKPTKVVAHLNIPSAKEMNATNATRFAIMLRIKLVPRDAPLEAASSKDESALKK